MYGSCILRSTRTRVHRNRRPSHLYPWKDRTTEGERVGNYRADMPLTEQQLYGIASDPRWADTMSAAFIGSAHSIQLAELPY
jgi:hypothetical protein